MSDGHSPEPGFWIAYDMEFSVFSNAQHRTRFDGLLELEDEIRSFYHDQNHFANTGTEWGRRIIEVIPPGGARRRFMLEYVTESGIREAAERIKAGRMQLGLG